MLSLSARIARAEKCSSRMMLRGSWACRAKTVEQLPACEVWFPMSRHDIGAQTVG